MRGVLSQVLLYFVGQLFISCGKLQIFEFRQFSQLHIVTFTLETSIHLMNHDSISLL